MDPAIGGGVQWTCAGSFFLTFFSPWTWWVLAAAVRRQGGGAGVAAWRRRCRAVGLGGGLLCARWSSCMGAELCSGEGDGFDGD